MLAGEGGKIDPSKPHLYVDRCWKVVDVATSSGGRGGGGGDVVNGGGRGLVCGSSLLVYFNFHIELKSKVTS